MISPTPGSRSPRQGKIKARKDNSSIENTPIIIREMKNIAQLLTQRYYDECIVDTIIGEKIEDAFSVVTYPPLFTNGFFISEEGLFEIKKRYVLIATGMVKAGFDLSNIDESKVKIEEDSITLVLPPPQITDIIVNPSGFETFEEAGFWSFNERKQIQSRAKTILKANALKKGILLKSKEQGEYLLERFFKSLGYQKVTIDIEG